MKKQNSKFVGETSSRPHFEGITKNEKGITLIALIITIIVMLILVGVTVNVALNGGLFDTANGAVRDTERDIIYDQIVGAMEVNNGKFNVKATYDSAKTILEAQGKTVEAVEPTNVDESTTVVNFKVTGKKGTYEYSITETEIKKEFTEIPPEDEVDILAELQKYEDTSIMDFFTGGYDAANGCYRTNYPGLEETATYVSYGCGIVRAFNEDNTHTDYIFTVKSDGATLDKVRVQPEVETIQISNGITAISNLEEFSFYKSGGSEDYSFGGLDVDISGGTQNVGVTMYKKMTAGEGVNAIILTNVEYFNSLGEFGDKFKDISGIESIYVPEDFIGTIRGNGLVTFSGEGNPGGLEETLIGDKTYYKMSI